MAETLEAETLALTLVRRALGSGLHAARGARKAKLVDRAKLVLSSDLSRRWTLAEIGVEGGVSQVPHAGVPAGEGMPLYRYRLRLRLGERLLGR